PMLRAPSLLSDLGLLLVCRASMMRTDTPTAILRHSKRIRSAHAAARHSRLYAALISLPTVDPFTFEHMRAALHPGDTYAIQMGLPRQAAAGSWIETFARYYLLPHLMVARARDADVVLSFHATPRSLGVRVTDVRHVAHDLVVSRVVHDGT